MKKLRFIFSFLLILSIAFISITQFTKDNSAQAANSIRISNTSYTLELGRYKTLSVYGTSSKVSWYSSNNWIASVSSGGKVTAKAAGTATITASVAGKKVTCKVTVLRLKDKAVTLTTGMSKTITVDGTKNIVTWSSSNKSIATVSSGGKITAIAPGIATITASVDSKKITSKVTVVDIDNKSLVMEVGGFSGSVKTLRINDTTSKITWSSSDESIATVNSNGRVFAKDAGTVTITASVDGVKLNCKIKVLTMSTRTFTLKMGETKKLAINGTTSEVIWHSNKRSVATITSDGTVHTTAPGVATIMAYVDGRNVKAKVTVVE
jgi:chitinase